MVVVTARPRNQNRGEGKTREREAGNSGETEREPSESQGGAESTGDAVISGEDGRRPLLVVAKLRA